MKNNHFAKRVLAMLMALCILTLAMNQPVKADNPYGWGENQYEFQDDLRPVYVSGITRPAAGKNPDMYSIVVDEAKSEASLVPDLVSYCEPLSWGELRGFIPKNSDPAIYQQLDHSVKVLWYRSPDGEQWKMMAPWDIFEYGYHYMAATMFKPNYHMTSHIDDIAYLDGGINNDRDHVFSGDYTYEFEGYYYFDDLAAIKSLSVFGVDEVVEPVAGEKPNFSSAYLYSSSCSIYNQKDFWNWYIPYGKSHAGTEFFDSFSDSFINAIPSDAKIMWMESEDGQNWEYMIDRKTGEIAAFETGKYYMVDIIIDIPEKGVEVGQWAWAYVNSKDNVADFGPFTQSPSNDYEIKYVFDNLVKASEPENADETQEVELGDLRFTAPGNWTLDDSRKDNGELTLYHGKSEESAQAVLKLQELEASAVEKNVQEGASLSAIAYEYMKNHAAAEGRKFKMHYALPEYEMNGLTIFKAVGILLKDTDNENSYSIADCSEERPFTQYVVVKVGDQYYVMYFINNESNFMDQIAFDELLSTLQDMKNLSIRLEGQEFSNIMGYLQAARYAYGLDEQGNKLYSNVLEIRNLNRKPINTNAVFNIYGTDEKGQEYLIKSGLKFYGLMGDRWWLNAGQEEITRVEFTEVTSTEAGNAVKSTLKANGDGSVLTIAAESAFNAKDVQIMLGADQFWDYPDSGSGTEIDLSQYKDKLESWQDYSAFTVNVIVYNK